MDDGFLQRPSIGLRRMRRVVYHHYFLINPEVSWRSTPLSSQRNGGILPERTLGSRSQWLSIGPAGGPRVPTGSVRPVRTCRL